jgi:hypothetical protein
MLMRLRASVQLGCFVGAARSSVVEMLLIGILGGVRITLHPQRNATTVRSTAAVLLQDNPTVLQCSDPMCARAPACMHACAHTPHWCRLPAAALRGSSGWTPSLRR